MLLLQDLQLAAESLDVCSEAVGAMGRVIFECHIIESLSRTGVELFLSGGPPALLRQP